MDLSTRLQETEREGPYAEPRLIFVIYRIVKKQSSTCTMSGSYNVQPYERIELIRGSENVIDVGLKFASDAKTEIDAFLDYTRPALAFDIESITKSLADIKAKSGIGLRVLRNYCRKYFV